MIQKKKKLTSLVTGGAGFVGSHVVDKLITLGHKVIVLDNLSTGKAENVNKKAKFYHCDISVESQIIKKLKKENINGFIFHCAAKARIQPSFIFPELFYKTNITGLLNVLYLAKFFPIKKFVFLGSSSVYGHCKRKFNSPISETSKTNPGSPYSNQKLLGESLVKMFSDDHGLPTVTCRLFNVYGPRQLVKGAYATVIGIFLKQKKANKKLTIVSPGTQRRDFTFVSDIVAGLLKAAESECKKGEIFNLGSGVNHSVQEIADIIFKEQEKVPERKGEYPYTLADIEKAKKLLNYDPKILDIKKGISLC